MQSPHVHSLSKGLVMGLSSETKMICQDAGRGKAQVVTQAAAELPNMYIHCKNPATCKKSAVQRGLDRRELFPNTHQALLLSTQQGRAGTAP